MTGLSAWLGQRSWLEALGYCVRLVYGSLLGSSGVFNVLNPLPSGERGLPESWVRSTKRPSGFAEMWSYPVELP